MFGKVLQGYRNESEGYKDKWVFLLKLTFWFFCLKQVVLVTSLLEGPFSNAVKTHFSPNWTHFIELSKYKNILRIFKSGLIYFLSSFLTVNNMQKSFKMDKSFDILEGTPAFPRTDPSTFSLLSQLSNLQNLFKDWFFFSFFFS